MKNTSWDTINRGQQRTVREQIVPLYHWMEQNKMNYKRGFTSSKVFAHLLICPATRQPFDPKAENWEEFRNSYYNLISRWRRIGYLLYRPETPDAPATWSVNEAILPPGTVTYTGVTHTIPLTEAEPPHPSESSLEEVTSSTAPQSTTAAAQAFLEAELKSIKVQSCLLGQGNQGILCNTHASVELKDITLWDIYQVGLALQKTLGTEYAREQKEPESFYLEEPELFEEPPEVEETKGDIF